MGKWSERTRKKMRAQTHTETHAETHAETQMKTSPKAQKKEQKNPQKKMQQKPKFKSNFEKKDWMILVAGALILFGIGRLCYDSFLGALILTPGTILIYRAYASWRKKTRIQQLKVEFKDFLYSLAMNLKAGYSLENAWNRSLKDLDILYEGNSRFMEYGQKVLWDVQMNISIQNAIEAMANQCEIEEIDNFSEVILTAQKSGGNLISILQKTADSIAEKIEVEQEIQTQITGKKMEQRIMCGMPFFMLVYLRITNPSYTEGLYHNAAGIIVVTVCLVGTIMAAIWGEHIMQIEV